MTQVSQVLDNIELLIKMMADMEKADPLYKPTNYWSFYEKKILPELKAKGLKDFRRREKSVLQSFGATDILAYAEPVYEGKIRGVSRLVKVMFNVLKKLGVRLSLSYNPQGFTKYFFQKVKDKFDKHSINIFDCPTSRYGNPQDIIEVNNTFWSLSHLCYCSMFIDSFDYMNFKDEMVYCEIGPGMGRSVEILGKLYKKSTFILFDIPPQLYISNQYLSKVYGDRVIQYEDAVRINPDKDVLQHIRGRIVLLPTWSIPAWKDTNIDISWNSATFSEMEPGNVNNYLNLIKNMKPAVIYINAPPKGNFSRGDEQGGNKQPVMEEHYFNFLKDKYILKTKYYTDYFLNEPEYMSYIFKRIE